MLKSLHFNGRDRRGKQWFVSWYILIGSIWDYRENIFKCISERELGVTRDILEILCMNQKLKKIEIITKKMFMRGCIRGR